MQIADALLVLAAAVTCTTCGAPSTPQLETDRAIPSCEEPPEGWATVDFPKLSFRMPPGFVRTFGGGCVDQCPTHVADDGRTKIVLEYLGDTRMIELDPDAFSELERHIEIVSGKPAEIVRGRLKSYVEGEHVGGTTDGDLCIEVFESRGKAEEAHGYTFLADI